MTHYFWRAAGCPLLICASMLLAAAPARAQVACPLPTLASGLQLPLGLEMSSQGNLLVSETGTRVANSGRISIVDPAGNRRTLLDGLPSGINDVGEPSGPAGLFLRGRTLYAAIGVGDVGIPQPGPPPGRLLPNPNPSSPILSSVLAIHFSAHVEMSTGGFTLTSLDHQALADGQTVRLSAAGETLTVALVADFENYIPSPRPDFPANIRLSNPVDLVAVGNRLYVTDGARNLVWQVDIRSGEHSALTTFPTVPNPLFGIVPAGGPVVEAVPTGIAYSDGRLLVALFRGVPFPPGVSTIEQVDPATGERTPFITGLKTAIDVLPSGHGVNTDYLVLQHASVGPFFASPGLLLHFDTPSGAPTVIANCLDRPSSMTIDKHTGTVYVTELLTGRIVAIRVAP
jgi:hypothetical protein